jgi:hypothetical protein
MGTNDWVAIGSYLTVAFACLIVVVLGFKAYKLIYKDGDK